MGRFATTAEIYAQFRPPYSEDFFRAVAGKLSLSKQQALIDLGTGPGLLALGFAPYVGRVVGVDPEPAMLAVARQAVARSGHAITLLEGRAEDLPETIGTFDIATIGRALHWMQPDALRPLFARLIAPGGVLLVCGSYSARDGRNPWLDDYNAARRAWSNEALWSESGKGERTHRNLGSVLASAGFAVAETIRTESAHEVSVEDLCQRVLTFSSSSPAALGERAEAMLADVEARLKPYARDGIITEILISAGDVARREGAENTG